MGVPTSPNLPVIFCFHGAGSNSTHFQIQARKLVQILHPHFQFVFLDAPFDSPPGPGVVDVFDELGPFHRWHCDTAAIAQFDVDAEEIECERATTRALISKTITAYGRENIAGVMGFSQGTRVATALCLDRDLLGEDDVIAFAIMISAVFPILPIAASAASVPYHDQPGENAPLPVVEHSAVKIPSIHVHGVRDPWRRESVRLMQTYYDAGQATVVGFAGGHQVPTAQREVDSISKAVLRAWEQRQHQRPSS